MTTYQTENNKQKLMIFIVVGQKYYLEIQKFNIRFTPF